MAKDKKPCLCCGMKRDRGEKLCSVCVGIPGITDDEGVMKSDAVTVLLRQQAYFVRIISDGLEDCSSQMSDVEVAISKIQL